METYKNIDLNNIENEIWRPITNYGGYYVSNLGRIKSERYGRPGQFQILKQSFCRDYLIVGMGNRPNRKSVRVHRIVAEEFVEKPKNVSKKQLEVSHENDIKTDNIAENLRWKTHRQNVQHSFKSGNRKLKLTPNKVMEIRKVCEEEKYTQKELSKIFKLSQSTISDIVNFKKWHYL